MDEKNTVLTFYKSEDEASLNKEPQGTIDIKNVAICTSADNSNQFIIVLVICIDKFEMIYYSFKTKKKLLPT